MLETLSVILLIVWALGLVSRHEFGGLIYTLLGAAIVLLMWAVFDGRRYR